MSIKCLNFLNLFNLLIELKIDEKQRVLSKEIKAITKKNALCHEIGIKIQIIQ